MSTDPAVFGPREFNERLLLALERLEIPYAMEGSVAAMYYSGVPRLTQDVDVMIDADAAHFELLVDKVQSWQSCIDPLEVILEEMLPAHKPINILDGLAGAKADVYVVTHEGLDVSSMLRRRRHKLYSRPDVYAWFLAPEDVILYKLVFFAASAGVSQKHSKDIHNMLRAVESEVDFAYVNEWVDRLGLRVIWVQVQAEYRA